MCRARIKRTTSTIIGSSDLQRAKASRAILKEGHQKRMEAIEKMTFKVVNPSVKHNHQRPYIIVFGHKIILNQEDAFHASRAGMKIYYE